MVMLLQLSAPAGTAASEAYEARHPAVYIDSVSNEQPLSFITKDYLCYTVAFVRPLGLLWLPLTISLKPGVSAAS